MESAEPRLPLTAQAFAATFNHLLQAQPWALARLQRHGGKAIRLNLPPLLLLLTIEDSGMVAPAHADTAPDATLGVSPLALLHVFASSPLPQELVHTAGDAGLAVDFGNVMQNLRWDAEEDLSKVFGDVLGHRLAHGGGEFFAFHKRMAENLIGNLSEYWTEEKPLLAKKTHVERYIEDVDAVRDDVERLEKRIARLES